MPHAPYTRSKVSWWPYALGAAVLASLMLLVAGLSARQAHVYARDRSETAARNLAHLIEAQLSQSLDGVDQDLQWAGQILLDELSRAGTWADAAQATQAQWTARMGRGAMHGRLEVRGPAAGRPDADRQQALTAERSLALATATVLSFSLPEATGTQEGTNGPAALKLSRAVRDPSGQDVALLSVAVPATALGRFFDGLELGPRGAATLRTSDLALVYRRAAAAVHEAGIEAPAAVGSRKVSAALRDAIAAQPREGHYIATVPTDRIERSNAYLRVGTYPLYVIIGLSTDDELRGWRTQAIPIAALGAFSALVTIAFAVVLYRSAQRRLQKANARFEAIIQSSTDAIVSKTLDGQVTSWNPARNRCSATPPRRWSGSPSGASSPPTERGRRKPSWPASSKVKACHRSKPSGCTRTATALTCPSRSRRCATRTGRSSERPRSPATSRTRSAWKPRCANWPSWMP